MTKEDLNLENETSLRLRPYAEILRISSDRIQIALPNHNAVFTGADTVHPLGRIVELLEAEQSESAIIQTLTAELEHSEGFLKYLLKMLEEHGCTYRKPIKTLAGKNGKASSTLYAGLENYCGQIGLNPNDALEKLTKAETFVIIPKALSEAVKSALQLTCLSNVRVMEFETGQDLGEFIEILNVELCKDEALPFLCFGFSYRSAAARLINELAVNRARSVFFGVAEGVIGRIGPFIIPEETACLECTLERVISNSTQDDVYALLAHRARTKGRIKLLPSTHPLFERSILDLMIMELSNIALGRFSRTIGGIIEYGFGATQNAHLSLLKTPRCPVCHPTRPHRMAWDARFKAPQVKAVDAQ